MPCGRKKADFQEVFQHVLCFSRKEDHSSTSFAESGEFNIEPDTNLKIMTKASIIKHIARIQAKLDRIVAAVHQLIILLVWNVVTFVVPTSPRRHENDSFAIPNQVCCTMLHWDCHAPWRRPRHSCIHAAWLILNWEVDARDTLKIHANAPNQMSSTSLIAVRPL